MSNARRPRAESPESPSPLESPATTTATPAPESAAEPRPEPPIERYFGSLQDLRTHLDKIAELRSMIERLCAESDKLVQERAVAVAAEDTETLMRASARREILDAKQEALAAELAAVSEAVKNFSAFPRVATLWRIYYNWVFEREKARLSGLLISGCPQLSLEQVVYHLQSVDAARKLEIFASEPNAEFILQANRLLGAIRETEFLVPEFEPAPVPVVSGLGMPYGDRGVNVEAALKEIWDREPDLGLPEALKRLHEHHPELWTPPPSDEEFYREAAQTLKNRVA